MSTQPLAKTEIKDLGDGTRTVTRTEVFGRNRRPIATGVARGGYVSDYLSASPATHILVTVVFAGPPGDSLLELQGKADETAVDPNTGEPIARRQLQNPVSSRFQLVSRDEKTAIPCSGYHLEFIESTIRTLAFPKPRSVPLSSLSLVDKAGYQARLSKGADARKASQKSVTPPAPAGVAPMRDEKEEWAEALHTSQDDPVARYGNTGSSFVTSLIRVSADSFD